MSNDKEWMPDFTWHYHTEYVEGKKLLRHIKNISTKYLDQYPEETIVSWWPDHIHDTLGRTLDLSQSGIWKTS